MNYNNEYHFRVEHSSSGREKKLELRGGQVSSMKWDSYAADPAFYGIVDQFGAGRNPKSFHDPILVKCHVAFVQATCSYRNLNAVVVTDIRVTE